MTPFLPLLKQSTTKHTRHPWLHLLHLLFVIAASMRPCTWNNLPLSVLILQSLTRSSPWGSWTITFKHHVHLFLWPGSPRSRKHMTKAMPLQPLTLVSSTLPLLSQHTHTTLVINNKLLHLSNTNNKEEHSNPRPPHPTLKDNLTLLQGNLNFPRDALTINTLFSPRSSNSQHHASVCTMRTMPILFLPIINIIITIISKNNFALALHH